MASSLPVRTYLTTQAHRREIKDKETLIALANVTSQTCIHIHIHTLRGSKGEKEFTHISCLKEIQCTD